MIHNIYCMKMVGYQDWVIYLLKKGQSNDGKNFKRYK